MLTIARMQVRFVEAERIQHQLVAGNVVILSSIGTHSSICTIPAPAACLLAAGCACWHLPRL